MEPQFQWQYTGTVVIPRTDGGNAIELPFNVVSEAYWDGDQITTEGQLTNEEIDAAAISIARQFLSTFESSDPGRRREFGQPSDVFLTSLLLVEV